MAVLALGFIGSAIGGSIGGTVLGVTAASIGGFIGSTIGSLVDNMLFGGNKVEGPRLNDKRVMSSAYGKKIPRLYGPENRLACDVIWSPGLVETRHKKGGKGKPKVITYTYSVSAAFIVGDGRSTGLSALKRIYANSKLIYDADGSGSPPVEKVVFDSVTFYPGTGSQMPDPTIEAHKGVGNAPAYRHTAYFVLKDLQLADFGNRLPNIEAVVEADESITVPEVIADILTACGVDLNNVGLSNLDADALVRGYQINGQSRGVDALQPLALAYSFDAAEQGGNFRFIKRGGAARGFLSYDVLGAVEGQQSGDPPEPVQFGLMPLTGLPREAIVTFPDPTRDYQPNAQPSRRQFGDAESNVSYDLPIVVDPDHGRQIADRMLFEADVSRRTARFDGNESLRFLWPGDVWLVQSPAGYTRLRITRLLRGANRVYQFETREDDPVIYDSDASAVEAPIPPQTIEPPGDSIVLLLDLPALRDSDLTDTGFYMFAAGELSGWRGGVLQRSTDGGDTFGDVADLSTNDAAIFGETTTPLAQPDSVDLWDRGSTVRVVLDDSANTLESVSETAVLNGYVNLAWIGPLSNTRQGELLQFTTATLVAPGVYDLSGLLRGRFGTAGRQAPSGSRFAMIDASIGKRLDFGAGDLRFERIYRPVSVLQPEADAATQTFTNVGSSLLPNRPVHVRARYDGTDVQITWVRRTRARAPWLGGGTVPLAETAELYNLRFYSAPQASADTYIRALNTTTPTATFTAAMIADAGLVPGDTLFIEVAQVGAIFERGLPTFAEVTL